MVIAVVGVVVLKGVVLAAPAEKPIRHTVLLQVKEDTDAAALKAIEEGIVMLKKEIDVIGQFEWGTVQEGSTRNMGFTHALNMTFANQEALDAYGPSPAHQEFVKLALPHVSKLLVFDYEIHTVE